MFKEGRQEIPEVRKLVKPEWFQAYCEGNALHPQADEGTSICIINTLLSSDTEMDWDYFAQSELSEDQITYLEDMMHRMHRRFKVNVATDQGKASFPDPEKIRLTGRDRLPFLWIGIKQIILRNFTQYTDFIEKHPSPVEVKIGDPNVEQIKQFFAEETDAVKWYKQIIKKMYEAFKSPEMKPLLAEYREGLPTKRWNIYRQEFEETILSYTHQLSDEIDPRIIDFVSLKTGVGITANDL